MTGTAGETIAPRQLKMRLKTCSGCRNKIASDFAFCRWCGEKQVVTLQKYLAEYETKKLDNSRRSYQTAPLSDGENPSKQTGVIAGQTLELETLAAKNRFSAPLLKTVIETFQSDAALAQNIVLKKASTVVLSIFVTLILILAAPIDAFLMAKSYIK